MSLTSIQWLFNAQTQIKTKLANINGRWGVVTAKNGGRRNTKGMTFKEFIESIVAEYIEEYGPIVEADEKEGE